MKNVLSFLLLLPLITYAQDLTEHRWQDRLIIISADSYQHPKLLEQVKELQNRTEELADRKLIIYQITPTSYIKGIENNQPTKDNTLYKKYNTTNKTLKVILIGLDGGRKLQSSKVVSAAQIFDQIDQMPMRQQELKLKN
ncbi:DUF4174 domain-containing protein [uncultured Aquimarina sp.]|uniref:DUF4174 domain-containing protein n=1 Tax=uncultured Aquimarina sp. TaxID=575652 RepID=UPI00262E8E75|nr:DUF4174 domain-containing protein [uncultured Aquimarina sp.]